MDKLVSLFKSDFITIRQLEKTGYAVFTYSGIAFVVGLIMVFTAVLSIIGVPLIIAGLVLLFTAMLRMAQWSKKPSRHVFCPYCATKNDVFRPHSEFGCDSCGKPILIDEFDQAVALEPVE